ncbi:hypothetical protein FIBSPDRAFT_757936, partial [Athelia psychrophila]
FDPPDMSTDPPSGFATGIKHPYAVQSLLLWARKEGLGLDSTWRHMNENRAPVTFVTTVDDNGRMVPGPVYISSDVTADTMALFLQDIKLLVEAEAEKIVAIDPGLLEHRGSLLAEPRIVIQEGWWPAFFMIDKSRAEKNGIQRVFPGIPIRICQFHVVQAILRWEKDEPSGQGRPKLSLVQKHHLLYAVRNLQRCRDSHDWDDKLRVFYRRVGVLSNDDSDKAERIKAYFNVNWFKLEWRDHWTDIGLPRGKNHDGMLSTNNWTERAFKTFHQIFLEGRSNKSLYRLVQLFANEWFHYYSAWKPKSKKYDKQLMATMQRGYHLWSTGTVTENSAVSGKRSWNVANIDSISI